MGNKINSLYATCSISIFENSPILKLLKLNQQSIISTFFESLDINLLMWRRQPVWETSGLVGHC